MKAPKSDTQNQHQVAVLRFIEQEARGNSAVVKVILFGSRARGDATERSDFDLALVAPGLDPVAWAKLRQDWEERIPTLCGLDLVLLEDSMSPDLKDAIRKEGKVIYAKS